MCRLSTIHLPITEQHYCHFLKSGSVTFIENYGANFPNSRQTNRNLLRQQDPDSAVK